MKSIWPSENSRNFCLIIFGGQGPDGRVRDPEVPAARDPGRIASGSAPDPDPQVPGEHRYDDVVPDVHVGCHLSAVRYVGRFCCKLFFFSCV